MAFITNQKGAGSKKLGDRLAELMAHSDRLDMLVGFFFFSGDNLRDELNVEISDFGSDEAQKYFDDMWEKSVPLTATEADRIKLIRILRDASVAADVTPYEAYYLVLKQYLEYQQSSLNEERLNRLLKDAGFDKYRYQVDAVAQAVRKIEQYNGVIIADVVGLGKSIIASLTGAMRRRRGLIICPPGLKGSEKGDAGGWYEYIYKFGLKDWKIWSRGDLEGATEMLKHDPDFDMVVVDEAHNFRNEGTEDYGLLANICFGRETVLLTATPFNNRPNDLLALLKLFLPAKSSPLGDIEEQFRLYQKRYIDLARLQKLLMKPEPNWTDIHVAMKKVGRRLILPPSRILIQCVFEVVIVILTSLGYVVFPAEIPGRTTLHPHFTDNVEEVGVSNRPLSGKGENETAKKGIAILRVEVYAPKLRTPLAPLKTAGLVGRTFVGCRTDAPSSSRTRAGSVRWRCRSSARMAGPSRSRESASSRSRGRLRASSSSPRRADARSR